MRPPERWLVRRTSLGLSSTFERFATLAGGPRLLQSRGTERFLRLSITVVNEEEAASVEPEAFEPVDDTRKGIQLLEEDGNLVHQKALSIEEE